MISLIKMYPADPIEKDGVLRSRAVFILAGLSGDEKPTVEYNGTLIANGSKYQVIGGSSHTYDEENQTWVQDAGSSGSGGSGGGGSDPTETTVTGTDVSIAPTANTIYKCATLESLEITDALESGMWGIVFTSGDPATTTSFPESIAGLESFAAETNTTYEINVWENRAVIGSWEAESE